MPPPDSSSSEDEAPGRTVARNSTLDAIVAVCLVVIGVVQVVQARRLGAEWTSDGPGAGYFPFYIGLILLVSGAAILVQSLRARKSDSSTFVDSVQLRRVLSVLVPSAIYVGAIMALGIYVASALFITLFMIVLGKYSVLKSVVIGVAVNALFFMMFEVWFKVPLFKGALEPLRFLGY
jgi:Tripartite tricarboxylate transporter TctB family